MRADASVLRSPAIDPPPDTDMPQAREAGQTIGRRGEPGSTTRLPEGARVRGDRASCEGFPAPDASACANRAYTPKWTGAPAGSRSTTLMDTPQLHPTPRRRILVVDDDPSLRLLLRTTLAADEFELEEVASAEEAGEAARFWRPSVVLLDVTLPGMDGLAFSKQLTRQAVYGNPTVILLTGAELTNADARAAGAHAILRKPFSPLELIKLIDELEEPPSELLVGETELDAEQLLVYARDLSRIIEVERAQRRLLQNAYRQTVAALADALEAKDPQTGLHAQRVQHYALTLTEGIDPQLLDDPSLEYGFLLHDVGKIGVPNQILEKRGPLSAPEWKLIQTHPAIGAEILGDVTLLQGRGIDVVRSHHERWDGSGYPGGLAGEEIPLGARIFALADTLDAMTSDRPYRRALGWDRAVDEILGQTGRQFDPQVVKAFSVRERRLRRIFAELSVAAA
jgi:response regulator RpfG family c-di-GMP phosphodiesterase